MAYQTRGRDPLLDSTTQAAIEKRGKELLGLGCLALAAMAALMIGTYTPDDPNWLVATDAPVQNWMGRFGASLAHPLIMIVGVAAWTIPVLFVAWGVRLSTHRGEDRVPGRSVLAPIAVALAAIYCGTLVPGTVWQHNFGLGGLFGDTVLGMLLTVLPFGPGIGVRLLSLGIGLGMVAILFYVAGFSVQELRAIRQFLVRGLIQSFDLALRLTGRGAVASVQAAQGMQARIGSELDARRMARAMAEPPVTGPRDTARMAAVIRPQTGGQSEAVARVRPAEEVARPQAARQGRVTGAHPVVMPPPLTAVRGPVLAGQVAMMTEAEIAEPVPPRAAERPEMPGGFLSALFRRGGGSKAPEAEAETIPETMPEDRLSARISAAVAAKRRGTVDQTPAAPERPRGPQPLILQSARSTAFPHGAPAERPAMATQGRIEPPVTGPVRSVPLRDEGLVALRAMPPSSDWRETWHGMPEEDEIIPDADGMEEDEISEGALGGQPLRAAQTEQRRAVVQHPPRKPQPSARAKAEAQPLLPLEDRFAGYEFPPLGLLTNPADVTRHVLSDEALEENARMLESVLDDYGVKGEIVAVRPGPVVTLYELEPAPGLKASRVIGLADDIARSMSALSARVSTVPGRSVIGIELPNANREKVVLREILSARDFGDSQMRLPLALGKDISGEPVVANLAKMPHLLIAGTTGSGKSVAINTMILSLLYKLTPEECRLIMIDPKMLELSVYDGIPHLLSPVVTDPKKAVAALKWVVSEMEERYRRMSKMGVRNIEGYNGRVREALAKGETFSRTIQTGFDDDTGDPIFETDELVPEVLPYIVVVVDEMADLMMVAGKEIEACIQRLAQMARASGIHLIMATQRPSVDVITGTIKANFPTRISFQVTSKIDSRTILGEMGAEQLLGMGDMLYMAGGGRITRIHGPFCSDEEVEEVVSFLKSYGPPDYVSGVVEGPDEETAAAVELVLGLGGDAESDDALYDMAVQIVARDRKCSTSYIQRKLAIGYNKAARLVEQMEDQGVVSPANAVGKREILVPEPH